MGWKETDCKRWNSKGSDGSKRQKGTEWKEAGTKLITGKALLVESIMSYITVNTNVHARIYKVVPFHCTLIVCLIVVAVAEAICLVWSRFLHRHDSNFRRASGHRRPGIASI